MPVEDIAVMLHIIGRDVAHQGAQAAGNCASPSKQVYRGEGIQGLFDGRFDLTHDPRGQLVFGADVIQMLAKGTGLDHLTHDSSFN